MHKILVDHHQEPDEASFDYGISNPDKSSTCEMIYDFIVGSGHGDKINEDIAECIYAGVVGILVLFVFPLPPMQCINWWRDLKLKGLQHVKVHEGLFDNFLENRLRFTGHVLLHRMQVFYGI